MVNPYKNYLKQIVEGQPDENIDIALLVAGEELNLNTIILELNDKSHTFESLESLENIVDKTIWYSNLANNMLNTAQGFDMTEFETRTEEVKAYHSQFDDPETPPSAASRCTKHWRTPGRD